MSIPKLHKKYKKVNNKKLRASIAPGRELYLLQDQFILLNFVKILLIKGWEQG